MSGKRYYIENNDQIKKIAYISGIVLLISVIALIFVLSLYKNKTEADAKIAAQKMNDVEMEIIESTTSLDDKTINEVIEENSIEEEISGVVEEVIITNETSENTQKEVTEKKLEFVVPLNGEITKDYADSSLIYSETLKEWTTHYGVDIQAEKGSAVVASEGGTVKSIKDDPRYGLTVTISHISGMETVYSCLLSAEFISEGDTVEKGQTIGTVGNSGAFEIADDYHLHFEMLLNGSNVNPTTYWN